MAITIDIDTARPYQVHVGTFLLEQAGPLVRTTAGGTRAVIVTDTNVGPLYQMPVKQSLEASGYEVSICTFEAGEAHKRAETYVAILEFVAEHELSRSDVIVALGGGVVGDVAGFVAATYMRGCKFVQIPTSLLAMVDSSVGGKTAIDLAAGKNLAGAFWQPSVVIADVGCLATLTPEQFADGCGEVVKHAVIADPELFAELEKTPLTLELLNRDVARVALIIARNIDIKRAVVVADERETNQRKLLNFGHSAGHAVEACEHFELGPPWPQDPLRPRCRCRLCRGAPRQEARGRHHRPGDSARHWPLQHRPHAAFHFPRTHCRRPRPEGRRIRMLARITPSPLKGTVPAIASKSMAHRLIICAALANGETHVTCNTTCADIEATVRCLTALGARIETVEDGFQVHPTMKSVEFGLLKALAGGTLDCGESGSTLRFMLPVACALGADATFVGQGRLGTRPLSPLSDEIIAAGCDLQGLGGFPLKTSGRMRPGTFVLPGNVSSQYISGLLLAAPLLAQPSCVQVTGLIESRPYINLTIQAMKAFGVEVNVERIPARDGQPEVTNFRVSSGSYRTPGSVAVEGDWSNAAFWLCAGAIGTDPITVEGVSLSSAQGDRNVLAALSRFGARIVRSTNAATVQSDKLAGFEMSAHDIPDLVPVISAVASLAQGRTFIRDCARLRIKESDRLATTTRELTALGAQVRIAGDDLIIKGVDAFTGGEVDSHNDHRIAMMAAIAASRATGEVVIHGAEAVNKSYPDFFDHYRLLGGKVTLEEE